MKRKYVSPAMEKIIFDVTDIITHSLSQNSGDEVFDYSETGGSGKPPKGKAFYNGTDVYVFGIKA